MNKFSKRRKIKTVYSERPKEITSEVLIITPNGKKKKCNAVWDTGTQCKFVISKKIQQELELEVTSRSWLNGEPCNICNASIDLLNGVFFENETLYVDQHSDIGCDILIGMDVITEGDFRIYRNKKREYIFMFQ